MNKKQYTKIYKTLTDNIQVMRHHFKDCLDHHKYEELQECKRQMLLYHNLRREAAKRYHALGGI